MKQAIGERRGTFAEAFNDRVADILLSVSGLSVRRRVKKVGRRRIVDERNRDLGDIDVLCLDATTQIVWAIEAKDFEAARTPAEAQNEVKKLVEGERSTVSLHMRRTRWKRDNLQTVLNSFGQAVDKGRSVEVAIVVSEDLVSARIAADRGTKVVPIVEAVSGAHGRGENQGHPKLEITAGAGYI